MFSIIFRRPTAWRLSLAKCSVGICNNSSPLCRKDESNIYRTPRTSAARLNRTSYVLSSTDSRAPSIPVLTYEEILTLKAKKQIILIDVREPSEIQETGKLPDSIHIPLKDVPSALGTLSNEEFKIKYGQEKPGLGSSLVFSCKAGTRSALAATTAFQLGYIKSLNYGGGFMDWKEKSEKHKA